MGRAAEQRRLGAASETSVRQSEVWATVGKIQDKLSAKLEARVASGVSASSLQLSLENEKLESARRAYIAAIGPAAENDGDIVGAVIAINGRISSADVYPSNGLFRKMWPKLLEATATEAIGERDGVVSAPPTGAAVAAFLVPAAAAKPAEPVPPGMPVVREVRESDQVLQVETKRKDGGFIHRVYVAK
jgi:hypothetical protein